MFKLHLDHSLNLRFPSYYAVLPLGRLPSQNDDTFDVCQKKDQQSLPDGYLVNSHLQRPWKIELLLT